MFEQYAQRSLKDFKPFLVLRDAPENQPFLPEQRDFYIAKADQYLQSNVWTPLSASDYLLYFENGDRIRYETRSFEKRTAIITLVLAECMTQTGRYLSQIIDGLWYICEESSWLIPAVNNHYHADPTVHNILPDVAEEMPFVDLFTAETAAALALAVYLLEEQLDEVSPLIVRRVHYEIDKRCLTPYLACDAYEWMGLQNYKQKLVNNWNPWINSNILLVTLLRQDEPRKDAIIDKVFRTLDVFLRGYEEDGGCDEGPDYWGAAGASLFDCLDLFEQVSAEPLECFAQPMIQNIGRYIFYTNIAGGCFANFADASTCLDPQAELIYRYGERIADQDLAQFGVSLLPYCENEGICLPRFHLYRFFQHILGYGTLKKNYQVQVTSGRAPKRNLSVWLPHIQVMVARQSADANDGFCVIAKGGYNNESHNHNDIGNLIVYHAGEPVLIDVGVETYTANTFNELRYTIWTMQSAYHNLPTINGYMQADGQEFAANEVVYRASDAMDTLRLSLADCYPVQAKIESWQRSVSLNRDACQVRLKDQYALEHACAPLCWYFMVYEQPDCTTPGQIYLRAGKDQIALCYDAAQLQYVVEEIPIQDERLAKSWKHSIYRIALTANQMQLQGETVITLQKVSVAEQ